MRSPRGRSRTRATKPPSSVGPASPTPRPRLGPETPVVARLVNPAILSFATSPAVAESASALPDQRDGPPRILTRRGLAELLRDHRLQSAVLQRVDVADDLPLAVDDDRGREQFDLVAL